MHAQVQLLLVWGYMHSRHVSAKNGLYARGDASLPEVFI